MGEVALWMSRMERRQVSSERRDLSLLGYVGAAGVLNELIGRADATRYFAGRVVCDGGNDADMR